MPSISLFLSSFSPSSSIYPLFSLLSFDLLFLFPISPLRYKGQWYPEQEEHTIIFLPELEGAMPDREQFTSSIASLEDEINSKGQHSLSSAPPPLPCSTSSAFSLLLLLLSSCDSAIFFLRSPLPFYFFLSSPCPLLLSPFRHLAPSSSSSPPWPSVPH